MIGPTLPLPRLDFANCMRTRLGARTGVSEAALRPLLPRGARLLARLLAAEFGRQVAGALLGGPAAAEEKRGIRRAAHVDPRHFV